MRNIERPMLAAIADAFRWEQTRGTIAITLTAEERKLAAKLGGGKVSDGLRRALEIAEEKTK